MQWYLYSCVDRCNQSSTLLGQYDGLSQQTDPSGQTLLGSIPNDKSQTLIPNVQVDFYTKPEERDSRYMPFFVRVDNVNNGIFERGEKITSQPY